MREIDERDCQHGSADVQQEEIERLRGEVRVWRGSHEFITREKERLETAIRRTLAENGHLADGDNCTLIHLVRAMPTMSSDNDADDRTPNVELRGGPAASSPERPA